MNIRREKNARVNKLVHFNARFTNPGITYRPPFSQCKVQSFKACKKFQLAFLEELFKPDRSTGIEVKKNQSLKNISRLTFDAGSNE